MPKLDGGYQGESYHYKVLRKYLNHFLRTAEYYSNIGGMESGVFKALQKIIEGQDPYSVDWRLSEDSPEAVSSLRREAIDLKNIVNASVNDEDVRGYLSYTRNLRDADEKLMY
jgi:uncharacterized protein with ATP-grasp and redox domains